MWRYLKSTINSEKGKNEKLGNSKIKNCSLEHTIKRMKKHITKGKTFVMISLKKDLYPEYIHNLIKKN